MRSILVALAVGNGTGPELLAIFEKVILALAAPYNLKIRFVTSPRTYHSYSTLLAINDTDVVSSETLTDADHYEAFCRQIVSLGACAIFRTSISAQALYMVRDRLQAVKVEHFKLSSSASILLVRDQAQGFYSGLNKMDSTQETVSRSSYFSKKVFEQILTFSLARSREVWGSEPPTVTLVYKFHLFDGLFYSWAKEWKKSYGVDIQFIQGDTMNRNLLAFGVQGNQLLICSNEYADIMQTMLLDRFGFGAQESACAENVYLAAGVDKGLSEYQTAHGSADDITGKGVVNPTATIRAAAALLERYGGCQGVQRQMDITLDELRAKNIRTLDQGGMTKTEPFVDALLRRIAPNLPINVSANHPGAEGPTSAPNRVDSYSPHRANSCLVVMDFQNDFMVQYKTPRVMLRIKEYMPRVVDWARREGMDIAWVRFLGDEKYQPATWRERNQMQGRRAWCKEGSWGAEIASCVQVHTADRVFDKKAYFDPFLGEDFTKYVTRFEHLVVVGLFADICVDAAVRGAFQRGLWTTVVRECTAGLHLPEEQSFAYMQAVYGSEVVGIDQFLSTGPVANL
jgi:nicotinamidase-related amidase/isocitrate/isopropylmalate dehydrogenase